MTERCARCGFSRATSLVCPCGHNNTSVQATSAKDPAWRSLWKMPKDAVGEPESADHYDAGKVQIELIPSEMVFAVATVLTYGAGKYAPRNWEKGMKWSRVFGSLMRHLWSWWAGRGPTRRNFLFGEVDGETGYSHLWHAAACLTFLVTYEERGMTKFDDRNHSS